MDSIELNQLELQVDSLLHIINNLQKENRDLRSQLARHAREKSHWYQHNRQTAGKIRKIISTLQGALG